MSPTVELDMRAFNASVQRLRTVNKRETTDFLRRLAKELLKYLVRLTPPFGFHPFVESFPIQRQAGRNAIKGDLQSSFKSIRTFKITEDVDSKLGKSFKKLIRQGRLGEASNLAQNIGIRIAGFLPTLDGATHKRFRTRAGRVRRNPPFIVADGPSVNARIKKVQQRVGYSKSGWKKAANALKFKLPKWVAGHNAPGRYQESGAGMLHFRILMENKVSFGLRFTTSIVPAALSKLRGSVEAQYVKLINMRHKRRTASAANKAAVEGLFLSRN